MRTGRSAWACCNSARISSKPRARRAARRRTLERSAPSTEPAAASSRAGSASVEARSGAWARSSGERGSASMSSATMSAEAGAAVDNLLVELLYLVVIMDIDNLLDPTGREELIEIEARTLTRLERVLQDRLRKALAKH